MRVAVTVHEGDVELHRRRQYGDQHTFVTQSHCQSIGHALDTRRLSRET
jgi:hypothetical protein